MSNFISLSVIDICVIKTCIEFIFIIIICIWLKLRNIEIDLEWSYFFTVFICSTFTVLYLSKCFFLNLRIFYDLLDFGITFRNIWFIFNSIWSTILFNMKLIYLNKIHWKTFVKKSIQLKYFSLSFIIF